MTTPVWAASGNDAASYSQWQSRIQSGQELKEAEKKLQAAYKAARKALGEKNAEADQLSREQQTWDKTRRAIALAKGAPGSPAFNQELISQAKERIRLLDAITEKGRVLAYHQYQLAPGQAMTGFMRIWQYEDGHAHVIIHTRHEEMPIQCEVNTASASHENGTITFSTGESRSVTGLVTPYDQGYRARVEINESAGYCPKGTDITGLYVRTDMPIPPGETRFEKVTACELGVKFQHVVPILR